MKKTHDLRIPDQLIKVLIDSVADTPMHYYCLAFMYAKKDARGSIYVGLMEETITADVITAAKSKMLKNYGADPDTAVLTSASYLGLMKPSEFDPDNLSGELLE
ncbi:hypothetical protein [Thiopseudomonas alkaliphila]|uniref:hypothetical protein n=1 Tax=Thiopseudomonas alkaliphila TaxID=1697053 RepID=UPI00257705F0|nr:hypothetical protein [Thiopseudomonas alkaliphila]MCK9534494.1 hypothetical protein [Pseudomonas sp.]MDM1716497.1 hypothetical protein [Thiopseudomonas alkaliphila]